jgi:hypothetical protein
MPDAGGIFTLVPSYLAVEGETIEVVNHNPPLEDIATALTNRLPRNGAAPMTGNLNAGGNKITNLAAGTAPGDAARLDQVVSSAFLSSVSALSLLANEMVYASGVNVAAKTPLTPFARTVLDDADAPAARATLGLTIGTDVQAYDADLNTIAQIAGVRGDVIRRGVSGWERLALGANGSALGSNGTDLVYIAAPSVVDAIWAPYNGGTGVIYDFAVNGTVATVTSPDFEDGYEYAFIFDRVSGSSGAATNFLVNFWRETDGAYAGTQTLYTGGPAADFSWISLYVKAPRVNSKFHTFTDLNGSRQEPNSGMVNAINVGYGAIANGLSHAVSQKLLRAQFSVQSASFDSGTIRMLRKKYSG